MNYALPIEENHQHGLHTRLLKSHFFRPWRGFSDPCSGLTFSGRIVGKTPRHIASYNFLKEVSGSLSAVAIKSWQAAILRSFCSGVKECGTKSEQIFRFRKSSTTVLYTVFLPLFTSSASILSER